MREHSPGLTETPWLEGETDVDDTTKRCCTCGTTRPLGDYNRYAKSADGRQPRCRDCQRAKRVEWYQQNQEAEVEKARAWNLANADRVRELSRSRYAANPERKLRSQRRSYAKHGKKWKARESQQRQKDPQPYRDMEREWRARNRESVAERKKRYRETNPNVRLQERANGHRRRAATRGGPGAMEIAARVAYFGNACWICNRQGEAIDHVKPLAKGGPHLASNLRPICNVCNSRKRDRWLGVERIAELRAWVLEPRAA